MGNEPLVSVCMITYNHEAFISEAIEGVLRQKTTFPIQLVIGEDRSTDRTREICLDYERRFPEIIRVLPREKNLGMSAGLRETLASCSGEFIAICEGDDYWSDPSKLSVQVAFLRDNPEYSACCHNATVIYQDDSKALLYASKQPDAFDFDDVLRKDFSIPSCSVVFRNKLLADASEDLILLDWVMYLVLSAHGKIKFLDRNMAVYRQHSGGWTNRSWTKNAKDLIDITLRCKEYFSADHEDDFDRILANDHADVCFGTFQDGDMSAFDDSFADCRRYWHFLSRRKRIALTIRQRISKMPLVVQGYRAFTSVVRDFVASRSKSAYLR